MIRVLYLFSFYIFLASFNQLSADEWEVDVRLVITADLKGAIRECECLWGQPGGLARRKSIFDQIRHETPEAFFIESGSLTNEQTNSLLLISLFNKLDYNLICPYIVDYDRLFSDINGENITEWLPFSFVNLKGNYFSSISGYNRGHPNHDERLENKPDYKTYFNEVGFEKSLVTQFENELLLITFTSLFNQAESDSMPEMNDYQLINWEETVNRFGNTIRGFNGISVLICNWDYSDPDIETIPHDITDAIEGLDIIIVGGSGFVEPEVKPENGILAVYPGSYGEYVVVLDTWKGNNGGIDRYEWQAISTETAEPDSLFTKLIEQVHKSEIKTFER